MKKCKICGELKPLKEMGDNSNGSGDGKRHQCKKCINKTSIKDRAKLKIIAKERIKMESRRAAKILISHDFNVDTISKIFQVHYNTAKNLIEK